MDLVIVRSLQETCNTMHGIDAACNDVAGCGVGLGGLSSYFVTSDRSPTHTLGLLALGCF